MLALNLNHHFPISKHHKYPLITNINPAEHQSSAGKINRLVLTPEGRTKLNRNSDRDFYSSPRFVTHVDDKFISTLTDLYRQRLEPRFVILDLMSSWISHLPNEVAYTRVVGHGLNAQELAKNQRLDYFIVKDLNQDQQLEFDSCTFDAVLCTVSVQYLQQPEKVFAEVFRILKPGGVFIVSFSNRLFYDKAISSWRDGTGYSRVQLVVQYFQCVDGFTQTETIRNIPGRNDDGPLSQLMKLFGLFSGSDPFYAVISYKNFKPVYEQLGSSLITVFDFSGFNMLSYREITYRHSFSFMKTWSTNRFITVLTVILADPFIFFLGAA